MSVTSKALIALSLCAVAATVNAKPATFNTAGERTMKISYSDLNLSSEAGQRTLAIRIRGAAKKVCAISTAHTSLKEKIESRDCMSRAQKTALASINASNGISLAVK